jgi:peptidyl-tRNA hydrolase
MTSQLPFGAIRSKPSGGAGGHNGLNSIIEVLGTDEFPVCVSASAVILRASDKVNTCLGDMERRRAQDP